MAITGFLNRHTHAGARRVNDVLRRSNLIQKTRLRPCGVDVLEVMMLFGSQQSSKRRCSFKEKKGEVMTARVATQVSVSQSHKE